MVPSLENVAWTDTRELRRLGGCLTSKPEQTRGSLEKKTIAMLTMDSYHVLKD